MYYAPETTLDYAIASLNTLGPFATSLAMFICWKVLPLGRRGLLIPLGATEAFVFGAGNFLGDIADLDVGDDLFFYGGAWFFGVSVAAGVIVLTAPNRWRWSGLLLLGLGAGVGLDSAVIWVAAWMAFVVVLWRSLLDEQAPA